MYRLSEKIKKDLPDYAESMKRFEAGEISPERFAGIRVPWGNYNQRGGDTYMARVRLPGGVISPRQLKALAHAAREWGTGLLHITTRQDIQIHHLQIDRILPIHEYLKDFDLSSRGGGGNTVRNVTACYLAGVCKEEVFDVSGDAIAITEQLLQQDSAFTLPRKFKIAFSGCGIDCARIQVNDIGLRAELKDGRQGYCVYVGGGMGARSAVAHLLEEFIPREETATVINAIKNVYYDNGNRKNRHSNRLRFLIKKIGIGKFTELYRAELAKLKKEGLIPLRDAATVYTFESDDAEPEVIDEGFGRFLEGSVIRQKQKGMSAVTLRIPQGDLDWRHADALGNLGDEFENLAMRTTQDQSLTLLNVRLGDLNRLYNRLKEILPKFMHPGTLIDVVACKGSRTCNLGLCNSPSLAEVLEDMIEKNFVDKKVFKKISLKVNGCPNACGQHPLGLIGFVGAVRKVEGRPVPHYRLMLSGKWGDSETLLADDTSILIPVRNLSEFLKDFLNRIEAEIDEVEDIQDFLKNRGFEIAREIKGRYTKIADYHEDKSYYYDLKAKEEFSMKGLGPGECGAGVLDMINADLKDAARSLDKGDEGSDPGAIRKALFYTARSLLVVRGLDPKEPPAAFSGFNERFVDTGIASAEFEKAKDVYESLGNGDPSAHDRGLEFATSFLDHVQGLYESMDAQFKFPSEKKTEGRPAATETATADVQTLDLRGVACPLNYVKTKMWLQTQPVGVVVDVLLDPGLPIQNVPVSLQKDGQAILQTKEIGDHFALRVEKKA